MYISYVELIFCKRYLNYVFRGVRLKVEGGMMYKRKLKIYKIIFLLLYINKLNRRVSWLFNT